LGLRLDQDRRISPFLCHLPILFKKTYPQPLKNTLWTAVEKNMTENQANLHSEAFVAQGSALKMPQISEKPRPKSKNKIEKQNHAERFHQNSGISFIFLCQKNIS